MNVMTSEKMRRLMASADDAKKNGRPLRGVFESFAAENKMAAGSVRNAYYSAAKRAKKDKKYADAICFGAKPEVGRIVEFDKAEARLMMKKILLAATDGRSVRSSIGLIARDPKTALRYQNKYRNMIAGDRRTVEKIVEEIKREKGRCYDPFAKRKDVLLDKLKNEINALYERIAENLRTENAALRSRISELEKENGELKKVVSGESVTKDYFENVGNRPARKIEFTANKNSTR